MTSSIDTVRAAWGEGMPDWIEALAQECDLASQNKVAQQLGRSAALVSQLLHAKYPGDLAGIEERFRAAFQASEVDCPVLGRIATTSCLEWRAKARDFQNTNSQRVRMYRACHNCPRFLKGSTHD